MLNKSRMKRNEKMARTKNRIKKMNFQKQERKYLPLSDEHKYVVEMSRYGRCIQDRRQLQQELIGLEQDEKIPRITGGGL